MWSGFTAVKLSQVLRVGTEFNLPAAQPLRPHVEPLWLPEAAGSCQKLLEAAGSCSALQSDATGRDTELLVHVSVSASLLCDFTMFSCLWFRDHLLTIVTAAVYLRKLFPVFLKKQNLSVEFGEFCRP